MSDSSKPGSAPLLLAVATRWAAWQPRWQALQAQRTLWAERDRRWALRLHAVARYSTLVVVLQAASRLGDGVLWYALIALLAVGGGATARELAAAMALAGAVNVVLYLLIKRATGRPRPYAHCADFRARAPALDQFSFPSGHTVHATAFTLLLLSYYPVAGVALAPLSLLIIWSRVALGLHYPSDVLAGAALGTTTATIVLWLF
jgi:undecaprenyl-diphosphatase